MAFSSISFLCAFFPLTVICYHLIPAMKVKNFFLIVVSLLFYTYGEGPYVLLMVLCAFCNYVSARLVARFDRAKRLFMWIAVMMDLGMLGVFKYTGMIVATIGRAADLDLNVPDIRLPVGISFFTFQALSYVIDVYRGKVAAEERFWRTLLYISFFPQLIAGPIIKYHDISAQIDDREVHVDGICRGMRRFILGLSKKVLLSDTMAVAADHVFSLESGELGMLAAWIGAVAYMLQIYLDFSGYSDMAIGMGKMFGFDFAENFRAPYAASSIQDFWRRWHISLTDWFREYLYIPLGGNRRGMARTWLNRLIVFFCTGLWHGAAWTYVLWGLYHGLFLTLETVFPKFLGRTRVLKHVYVLLVVCAGFVIFRSDTLEQALMVLSAMFIGSEWDVRIKAATMEICDGLFLSALAVSVICAMPIRQWAGALGKRWDLKALDSVCYAASVGLLLLCMMSLAGGTYHPFIYFRF